MQYASTFGSVVDGKVVQRCVGICVLHLNALAMVEGERDSGMIQVGDAWTNACDVIPAGLVLTIAILV